MYYIIIKLLIMENHPSRNRKRNSEKECCEFGPRYFEIYLTLFLNLFWMKLDLYHLLSNGGIHLGINYSVSNETKWNE